MFAAAKAEVENAFIRHGFKNQVDQIQQKISEVEVDGRKVEQVLPSDDALLLGWGIPQEEITDLHRHGVYHANSKGEFTFEDMKNRLIRLGCTNLKADAVAAGLILAFKGLMGDNLHISNIKKLLHVTSSQIFDRQGNFDPARFKQIKETYGQKGYLTPADFQAIFKEGVKRDSPDHPIGCIAFKAVGPGELVLLGELGSDSPDGGISLARLEKIFTKGSMVFWEIEAEYKKRNEPV